MPSTTASELKEIHRVLRRLSPRNIERLRNYALHLELEEIEEDEPPLSPEDEERIAIARAEIDKGKGRPFKRF